MSILKRTVVSVTTAPLVRFKICLYRTLVCLKTTRHPNTLRWSLLAQSGPALFLYREHISMSLLTRLTQSRFTAIKTSTKKPPSFLVRLPFIIVLVVLFYLLDSL